MKKLGIFIILILSVSFISKGQYFETLLRSGFSVNSPLSKGSINITFSDKQFNIHISGSDEVLKFIIPPDQVIGIREHIPSDFGEIGNAYTKLESIKTPNEITAEIYISTVKNKIYQIKIIIYFMGIKHDKWIFDNLYGLELKNENTNLYIENI